MTYQRGSQAAQRARRTHDPGDLHEWRKRVKDLWHQLAFLKPPREQPVSALAERMKRLGQLLGDDHDLFLIEDAAGKTAGLTRREKEAIAKLTKPRQARLQRRAFRLGRQLFAEKPAVFVRRMKRYGKSPPQIVNGAN